MGILLAACLCSFWTGWNAGVTEGKTQAEITVMESGDWPEDGQQEAVGSQEEEREPSQEEVQSVSGNTIKSEEEQPPEDVPDRSGILLVNKHNKLPEDYEVELKRMPDKSNYAAEAAYQPLCDMVQDARREGLYLEICSSYRSVGRQKELFEEDMGMLVRQGYSYLEAYDEVAKETMPPGYSEHSSGLAFDIVSLGYQMLDENQEDTAENQWLQEHCAEYGFILRYPKGKEDITGVSYESWHYRYVGIEAAEYIMEKGITLEEFLEEEYVTD